VWIVLSLQHWANQLDTISNICRIAVVVLLSPLLDTDADADADSCVDKCNKACENGTAVDADSAESTF
jgi:hypothetical protein